MSGKTINIQQVKLYMNYRKQNIKQVAAAAKTSISERSARRIDKGEHCSFNVKTQRNWRTRQDPLAEDGVTIILARVRNRGICHCDVKGAIQVENPWRI